MSKIRDADVQTFEWGELVWLVSGEQGMSSTMTFGRCTLYPGRGNPRHYHPNCDEILHVLSGGVEHTLGDETFEMGPGDTISIPAGTVHNATCVSEEPALTVIAFSSPNREFVAV